jgi:hypothetical protein
MRRTACEFGYGRYSLLICALLTVAVIQARRAGAVDVIFQPLASITNDRNADLQNLGVLLVLGRVVGLRFDTINGKHPHQSYFSLDEMTSGAVLDGDGKHKAIVLRGSIDSTAGKADLVVTYLANGLSGRQKDCPARMVRDESGQWHIVNIYDQKWVDHLVVRTRALGIATIQGICPARSSVASSAQGR